MLKRTILYGTGLLLLSALVMTSCNSTDKLEKQQQEEIQQFLDDNPDLHFTLKKSGLYYLEMVPGSGDFAATHDTAYLFYSIYYLDGTQVDSNFGTSDTCLFPVDEGWVIKGVDEAVTYMHEGGYCKIIVPTDIGFGNSGYPYPAYKPLLFELYLARLVRGPVN